jgi:hypothetical protein
MKVHLNKISKEKDSRPGRAVIESRSSKDFGESR